MMRGAVQQALVDMLSTALPEVPVKPLPVAGLAQELTALHQAAVWVIYLGGDFELPENLERAGELLFGVTLIVRDYSSAQNLSEETLALVERVDAALSGKHTDVPGVAPLSLVRDGLVEPPEGVQKVLFYELVFQARVSEEIPWPM